jgi:hypothetical protein
VRRPGHGEPVLLLRLLQGGFLQLAQSSLLSFF